MYAFFGRVSFSLYRSRPLSRRADRPKTILRSAALLFNFQSRAKVLFCSSGVQKQKKKEKKIQHICIQISPPPPPPPPPKVVLYLIYTYCIYYILFLWRNPRTRGSRRRRWFYKSQTRFVCNRYGTPPAQPLDAKWRRFTGRGEQNEIKKE